MTLYDEMQQIASELLGDPDLGQPGISLVQVVPGNGPAHNPGPSTRTVTPVNGVARGVSFKYVTSGLAVASDLQATIPADTVVPKVGDKMIVQSRELEITQVIPKPAAGTVAVYTCILKRG